MLNNFVQSQDTKQYIKEAKKRGFRCLFMFVTVFLIIWSAIGSIITHLISLSGLKIFTVAPFEQLTVELYLCTVLSLIIGLPYLLYEVYRYVSPGLYENERKAVKWFIVPFYITFVVGGIVTIEFILKRVIESFEVYYISGVDTSVSLENYISLVVSMFILSGVLCCIPNVTGILTYTGVLSHTHMIKYAKHFIVVSLVFSAIITPGADILSLVLLESPILILYGVSILIAYVIGMSKNNRFKKACVN